MELAGSGNFHKGLWVWVHSTYICCVNWELSFTWDYFLSFFQYPPQYGPMRAWHWE